MPARTCDARKQLSATKRWLNTESETRCACALDVLTVLLLCCRERRVRCKAVVDASRHVSCRPRRVRGRGAAAGGGAGAGGAHRRRPQRPAPQRQRVRLAARTASATGRKD
eukprot:4512409-Prymnesium_polylepis.1